MYLRNLRSEIREYVVQIFHPVLPKWVDCPSIPYRLVTLSEIVHIIFIYKSREIVVHYILNGLVGLFDSKLTSLSILGLIYELHKVDALGHL
jgi:hypothetical protein